MKIELKTIKIKELVAGYSDNEENGVVGYGGKLDIRPPYQREFVYNCFARKIHSSSDCDMNCKFIHF